MFVRPVLKSVAVATALFTAWEACRVAELKAAEPKTAEPKPVEHFSVDYKKDRWTVTYGGRPVADYVYDDPVTKRPYITNVRTPSGIQVTRTHPPVAGVDLVDHETMHPGIWWGFGNINGEDFWRNKATIRGGQFRKPNFVELGKYEGINITDLGELVAADGEKLSRVLISTAVFRHPSGFVFRMQIDFFQGSRDLTFGDQEEMGLGVRVSTPLAEKNGGSVTSSGDRGGAKTIWGIQAPWCDYSGTIDGRKVGITMVPASTGRRPTWWHVRDYGLMVANAFGKRSLGEDGGKIDLVVKSNEDLTLKYFVVVHDTADYDPAATAKELEAFVKK